MKINTVALVDFRAFPGPAPTTFELDGKNLLVYGENGSGKSSLFKALKGFFAYGSIPRLRDQKNSFSGQSFEYGLRKGCEIRKVPMRYTLDTVAHQAQGFLDALKLAPKPGTVVQADWTTCLQRIEMFKNVVMNPYSHPSAPNIPRQEVVDAIAAVERFLELVGKK